MRTIDTSYDRLRLRTHGTSHCFGTRRCEKEELLSVKACFMMPFSVTLSIATKRIPDRGEERQRLPRMFRMEYIANWSLVV